MTADRRRIANRAPTGSVLRRFSVDRRIFLALPRKTRVTKVTRDTSIHWEEIPEIQISGETCVPHGNSVKFRDQSRRRSPFARHPGKKKTLPTGGGKYFLFFLLLLSREGNLRPRIEKLPVSLSGLKLHSIQTAHLRRRIRIT